MLSAPGLRSPTHGNAANGIQHHANAIQRRASHSAAYVTGSLPVTASARPSFTRRRTSASASDTAMLREVKGMSLHRAVHSMRSASCQAVSGVDGGRAAGEPVVVVGEQLPYAAGRVGEGVLVGREHLGRVQPADAFQGVQIVAEGIGDGGVVGILVQADVRGDPREQVVAGEEAAVAGEGGRVGLLQVEADVAGRVARGPDRAQAAAGQVEELAGDDTAGRGARGRRWAGRR